MEKEIKADDTYEEYQPGLSNLNFEMELNNFADRKDNNQNKDGSIRSANSFCSTGQNLIYNYYFGSEPFSSDEKQDPSYKKLNSKNFISKSSYFTEETKENSENSENSSNSIQTPKKAEEEKEEENPSPPPQNKPINPPLLLILQKMVNNDCYALYQNLDDYSFSIIHYTLKEVKDYSKQYQIIKRNDPYLDNVGPNKKLSKGEVNDIIKNFNFYWNYLASIGEYVAFFYPIYWNINNVNK